MSARIVGFAVVATVAIVGSLARYNSKRLAREEFQQLQALREVERMPGGHPPLTRIGAPPAEVSGRAAVEREMRRMCRGMLHCDATGSDLEYAIGVCMRTAEQGADDTYRELTGAGIPLERLATELATTNDRCEDTCPSATCYGLDEGSSAF